MNSKGFTIIELLSSITIMCLIATITSFNFIKIFDNYEQSNEDNKKKIIEKAACTYIELTKNNNFKKNCLEKGCTINTNILIKEGLLKDEDITKEQNIFIKKRYNQKICEIK